ncbi:MAG: hydrogenase [Vicinamibacterales bacterium]
MDPSEIAERRGHRLLQAGALLFLVALFVGVAVPAFTGPRLGLATHLLGITQGLFLMVLGLAWPRLDLTPVLGKVASVLALFGCAAPWTANLLGAVWGAGNSLLPMAAGAAHGAPFQEGVITVLLRGGGAALIGSMSLGVWGLRSSAHRPAR